LPFLFLFGCQLNSAGLPFTNVPPPTDNPGPGMIHHPKTRDVHEFMSQ
jgi:hypothetical protein